MKGKIALVLMEGFEETEAVIPVDVLRRIGEDVILCGAPLVSGAHGVKIGTDCRIEDIIPEEISVLILPGGMPGAANLRDSDLVVGLVKKVYGLGKFVAAICAAPIVLQRAGIISGRNFTCYPSFKDEVGDTDYTGKMTERDGLIITGKGPGAAFEFAFRIADAIGKRSEAEQVFGSMFVVSGR